jgi:hypothetical protein
LKISRKQSLDQWQQKLVNQARAGLKTEGRDPSAIRNQASEKIQSGGPEQDLMARSLRLETEYSERAGLSPICRWKIPKPDRDTSTENCNQNRGPRIEDEKSKYTGGENRETDSKRRARQEIERHENLWHGQN